MFQKYDFIIDGNKIHLYTNIPSIISKLNNEPRSFLKTIPCEIVNCGKESKIHEKENVILVCTDDKKNINIDKKNNNAFLTSPINEFRFPDLLYVTLGMFNNLLKNEEKYLLHSAAVADKDDNSIIIIGDPGSGKSTLAYHLIKNYNYKLISNDTTAITMKDNQLKTITGTKQMQLRLGAVRLYFPEMLPYLEHEENIENEWDCKPYINNILEKDNVPFVNETNVKSIFKITTAKNTEFSIREEEDIDKQLYIYEQLIRQIRNTRNLIVGYNYPLPSFETDKVNQEVANLSKKIVETTNIYDIRGGIEDVAKEMVKVHEK